MRRSLRTSAFLVLAVLFALSSFAQERPLVGTVLDVDEGRGRLQIESDASSGNRMTIEIDSLATTWRGFGTMIAGKPEIFTGSSGLANVRLGDRIEIRGSRRGEDAFVADQVTLLGREVPAPQVGVGQTRPPDRATTPTEAEAIAAAVSRVEGTVRQINLGDGRVVIQTPQRRMISIRTTRSTPVWFEGEQYRVANLEIGDRIRVEVDPRDAQADDAVARRIDVLQSSRDAEGQPGARVTSLEGTVVRTEPTLNYAYVNDGRADVRVDMSRAEDAYGEPLAARDLRTGERVSISGSYDRTGDRFLASTVRFGPGAYEAQPDIAERYGVVTISGSITRTLDDGPTITVRETETNTPHEVWVVRDLCVRTRDGGYTNAGLLQNDDVVVVDAFRDSQGTLIGQTIRLRNR